MSEKIHHPGRVAAGFGVAAILGAGGMAAIGNINLFTFDPHFDFNSDLNIFRKPPPPKVVGAVQPKTISLGDVKLNLTCDGILNAGVSASAIDGTPYFDTTVVRNKVWMVRAPVCSVNNQIESEVTRYGTRVKGKETITKVVAKIPPPFPLAAATGLDMMNVQNCIDVTPGENERSIQKQVKDYEAEKNKGNQPQCDYGWAETAPFSNDGSANIIGYSQILSQAGLERDLMYRLTSWCILSSVDSDGSLSITLRSAVLASTHRFAA